MSKNLPAKNYSIKGFKEKLVKGINIFLKKGKTKSVNMIANCVTISQ